MKNTDYLALNGKLLQSFLAVYENESITRAAEQLGVTQSAVSHMLERLRVITDDPLFVKSGRNVVATAHATELAVHARKLLDQLREFATQPTFHPTEFDDELIIAAGDMQRDLLLPRLFERLRSDAPKLRLRVIPSDVPSLDMLRDDHCFMAISPRLPDGGDILHRRLFTGNYAVFYDATQRPAPKTLKNYLAAEHVSVMYEPQRTLDIDRHLEEQGIKRSIVVRVPSFSGIAHFLQGSSRLATLPAYLKASQLAGLQQTRPPVACPDLPMYAIWHQRHRNDPIMRWVLNGLYETSQQLDILVNTGPSNHKNLPN